MGLHLSLFLPISHSLYFSFSPSSLLFCRCSSVLVGEKKTAIDRSHGYRRDCLRHRDPTQQFLPLFVSFSSSTFFSFLFIFSLFLSSLRFVRSCQEWTPARRNVLFPSMKGEKHTDTERIERGGGERMEFLGRFAPQTFVYLSIVHHRPYLALDRSIVLTRRLYCRETAAPGSFSSPTTFMNRYRISSIHHIYIHTCIHIAKYSKNENDLRE